MQESSDRLPLAGRTALVTGATRRLGAAIASTLGAAGAALALHYRSDEAGRERTGDRLSALGVPVHWFQADLADADAGGALVLAASETLGGLDVLVNNAATFRKTPLATLAVSDFDEQMAVNARSVFALSLAAGRLMKAAGRGVIVNLADHSAERPWGTHIPYCASKAAVVSLTRGFAAALAPEVRVNAVAPGEALPPEDPAQGSGSPRRALIPGPSGAEAIAEAVAFLVRAEYLTGVVLTVDGGRSIS